MLMSASPGATRSNDLGSSSSKGERRSTSSGGPLCCNGARFWVTVDDAVLSYDITESAELPAREKDLGVGGMEREGIDRIGALDDRRNRFLVTVLVLEL